MSAWWFYIVAIFAALLLVNSVPHLVNGLSGRRFPSPFSGGPGTEDEPWRNVLWGAGNLIVGGLLLWVIRDGLSDWIMVVEMLVIGTAGGTILGHAFGHPERYSRKR